MQSDNSFFWPEDFEGGGGNWPWAEQKTPLKCNLAWLACLSTFSLQSQLKGPLHKEYTETGGLTNFFRKCYFVSHLLFFSQSYPLLPRLGDVTSVP